MKLFISYSRDDKAWVYELWRALRDRAHHDVWIDQQLIPAQDWWESILQNIETCECFFYIMTPKSTESIYCTAELNYAIALNKPVLPLMLKTCDMPESLRSRRIQYGIVRDDMSMGDTLFTVEQGLGEVRIGWIQKKYSVPSPLPSPPDEPKPERKPEQFSEVFMLAEEAATENNISLAKKLFHEVMEADPSGWGLAAAERLGEVSHEHNRNQEYLAIVQMLANPTLTRGAKAAWRVYLQKYGITYDPNNIAKTFAEVSSSDILPITRNIQPAKQIQSSLDIKPSKSIDLMVPPFNWIEIPAGQVTLGGNRDANGGYISQPIRFDVASFSLAKYPLTNAQFAKFLNAGGYENSSWWTTDGWQKRITEGWAEPLYWNDRKWNGANDPVVGISWYEAIAFCQWLSSLSDEYIILPTDQQWQRAAQGDTKRAYPYGEDFNKKCCNFNTQSTTEVTLYEGADKGNSPFGIVDMSGNIWEWCLTKYHVNDNLINGTEIRVLRGGSWRSKEKENLRVDCRNWGDPFLRTNNRGFRIARN